MKKWVLLTAAAVLSACSVSSSQEGKHTGGIPVKVMEITKTENAGTRSYVGTASAAKSAYLFCRYPGRLVRLHVEKGDFVQAGDVIAEVESQSVISSWQISRSMLEQAEDGYRRARQVYDAGSMPDVKMVEVETKLAQARASADAAEAAMEDCRIKAPFSGVIGEVFVSEGVELDVSDNGPGFTDQILEHAFEPYVTTKSSGTGLGLATIKKIAEEHGAMAAAENRKDADGNVCGARLIFVFHRLWHEQSRPN